MPAHHNEIAVDEFPKKMANADYKIQKLYDPPTYAGNSLIATTPLATMSCRSSPRTGPHDLPTLTANLLEL